MTIHGSGESRRSFVYIDDVSSALDIVLHHGVVGEAYNIGTCTEMTVRQVAQDIAALLGLDPAESIEFTEDRRFNDRSYLMDSGKMQSLGWQPATSWEKGLALTIDWYKMNPHYWPRLEDALADHPAMKSTCDVYVIGLAPEQVRSIRPLLIEAESVIEFASLPGSLERLLIEVRHVCFAAIIDSLLSA